MTKLRDIPIIRKPVELSSGHTVEVRGINASDLVLLTTMFGPQIAMAYAKFKDELKSGQTVTEEQLMKLLMAVMHDSPKLIGWIISIGNDDPDEETVKMVSQFPAMDQVALLHEIVNLTFASEATVKKLSESLSGMILTISGAVKANRQKPSTQSGIGESAEA